MVPRICSAWGSVASVPVSTKSVDCRPGGKGGQHTHGLKNHVEDAGGIVGLGGGAFNPAKVGGG